MPQKDLSVRVWHRKDRLPDKTCLLPRLDITLQVHIGYDDNIVLKGKLASHFADLLFGLVPGDTAQISFYLARADLLRI